jgi:SAM-dependent methyltransferase
MSKIHGALDGLTDSEVFQRKLRSLDRWWDRFGGKPNMEGKRVLEIGCARGDLSVDIALSGADQVIGVDISPELVAWANQHVAQHYPRLTRIVEFRCTEVKYLDERPFDYVVSKATFEHIYNLEELVLGVGKRLRSGGRLYSSFGPLWKSPFGDHRRFHRAMEKYNGIKIPQVLVPWMHLVVPESILNRTIIFFNERKNGYLSGNFDVHAGLNKMTLAEYLQVFYNSRLRVEMLQINVGESRLNRVFSAARRFPFFKELLSRSITVILCKE